MSFLTRLPFGPGDFGYMPSMRVAGGRVHTSSNMPLIGAAGGRVHTSSYTPPIRTEGGQGHATCLRHKVSLAERRTIAALIIVHHKD